MTQLVVLSDYADGARTLSAGTVIDSTLFDVPTLQASGCALVPLTPAIEALLPAFRAARGSAPAAPDPSNLQALLLAAGALGGGGGLTFTNYFPNDPGKGVYTDWAEFMAAVALIPIGTLPTLTIACVGTPFVVPSAGMPVNGWDMRGGVLRSFYFGTGAVVLDLPAGVKIDNCFGITDGLVLVIAPAAGAGVLEWSALPPQAARIFAVGPGCYVRNNGAGALMRSPGDQPGGTTHVLSFAGSNFGVADPPLPVGAKLLFLSNDGGQNDDGGVLVQQGTVGGAPTDCLANNGTNNTLVSIFDDTANPLTRDVPTWQPSFTGTVALTGAASDAQNLTFTTTNSAFWAGNPTTTRDAIDRLAAAVAGLLGGPIP